MADIARRGRGKARRSRLSESRRREMGGRAETDDSEALANLRRMGQAMSLPRDNPTSLSDGEIEREPPRDAEALRKTRAFERRLDSGLRRRP